MADPKSETPEQKQERERREAEERRQADDKRRADLAATQDPAEREKINKEYAERTQKDIEARTQQAYQHEDPTPTQAENDAAKLNAAGGGQQNPGFGGGETPEAQKRRLESQKGGGYQTRSSQR